VTLTLTLSGQS